MLRELLKDVGSFKTNANDINSELKEHSTLFDRVTMRMAKARDAIARTTQRLVSSEAGGGHVSHVWILLVFAFLVFVFIFLMLKFKR